MTTTIVAIGLLTVISSLAMSARALYTKGFNAGYQERINHENRELKNARVELKWYRDKAQEVGSRGRSARTLSAAQEEALKKDRPPTRIRRANIHRK